MILSKQLFNLSLESGKILFYGFRAEQSYAWTMTPGVELGLLSVTCKAVLASTSVQGLIS